MPLDLDADRVPALRSLRLAQCYVPWHSASKMLTKLHNLCIHRARAEYTYNGLITLQDFLAVIEGCATSLRHLCLWDTYPYHSTGPDEGAVANPTRSLVDLSQLELLKLSGDDTPAMEVLLAHLRLSPQVLIEMLRDPALELRDL